MNFVKRHILKAGIIIIIGGFYKTAFFAGLPPQDPPKKLLIEYLRNKSIANTLMTMGLVILISGFVFNLFSNKNSFKN